MTAKNSAAPLISKVLSQTEIERKFLRLGKTDFKTEIANGFLKAKINGKIVNMHIDRYGRLFAGLYLLSDIDENKRTTVLISKEDSIYNFKVIQE